MARPRHHSRELFWSKMINIPSILESASSFIFFVGEHEKPANVQPNLFKYVSPVLDAMIHSQMKEGIERKAILADVEWAVFAGICEYAYTEDYFFSLLQYRGSDSTDAEDSDEAVQAEQQNPHKKRKITSTVSIHSKRECPECHRTATRYERYGNFECCVCIFCRHSQIIQSVCSEYCDSDMALFKEFYNLSFDSPHFSSRTNIESVCWINSESLSYQAKLCVLSRRYLMQKLTNLCLFNLHQALTKLRVRQSNTSCVLDLLSYVYTEEEVEAVPELRAMVLLFAAAHMKILRTDERLDLILAEPGRLGPDLLHKVLDEKLSPRADPKEETGGKDLIELSD